MGKYGAAFYKEKEFAKTGEKDQNSIKSNALVQIKNVRILNHNKLAWKLRSFSLLDSQRECFMTYKPYLATCSPSLGTNGCISRTFSFHTAVDI
jgi:hypothetical protein